MYSNPDPFHSLRLFIFLRKHITLTPRWHREDLSHPYTHLLFIESGYAYLRDNGKTIIMEPGKVYLVPSRYRFSYGCDQKHTQLGFLIKLMTTPNADLLTGFGKICSMPYTPEEYQALLDAFYGADGLSAIRLQALLLDVIYRLGETHHISLTDSHSYSKSVSDAIDYISKNLSAGMTVKEISNALWISESKLRNDFKEQMHITIGKYIEQCLFDAAQKMLEDPTIPIGQISQELGFCDHSYFSGKFKKKYNCTPAQFRQKTVK